MAATILPAMALRLVVDEMYCSGCRACEVACSDVHENTFSPALSRLHALKRDAEGIDRPIVCHFCAEAPCAAACPTDALSQQSNGVLQLDATLCQGCGECAKACPHRALRMHPRTGQPLVCDLYEGEPACVAVCATGALSLEERE